MVMLCASSDRHLAAQLDISSGQFAGGADPRICVQKEVYRNLGGPWYLSVGIIQSESSEKQGVALANQQQARGDEVVRCSNREIIPDISPSFRAFSSSHASFAPSAPSRTAMSSSSYHSELNIPVKKDPRTFEQQRDDMFSKLERSYSSSSKSTVTEGSKPTGLIKSSAGDAEDWDSEVSRWISESRKRWGRDLSRMRQDMFALEVSPRLFLGVITLSC
ncbi:unnamed protein product [Protopolystoma xenopodis]|uniref:Uncharacterized protein n=1 Tax=Protopolystoma xenopodis TaxID=117903 RepID=A0A448XNY1_9PLAT|nr:unnamed protein product [Protopolystoma xenopodis]